MQAEDVGIISPYNAQLSLMQTTMGAEAASLIEAKTVDKYQGRDKACILLSFVRSNTEGNIGSLLADWRRINVAITRAKAKLIMVGSRRTIMSDPFLAALMVLLDKESWMVRLPSDAGKYSAQLVDDTTWPDFSTRGHG